MGYWLIVLSEVAFFQAIPYWFIVPHPTPVNLNIIIIALVILFSMVLFICLSRRVVINLLLICLLGILMQFLFGISKGGIDSISSRMIHTGHVQFMRLAVKVDNIADFIRDYEANVKGNKLGFFAPSKPPGTMLAYVLSDRLANNGISTDPTDKAKTAERENRLVKFATYTWPVIATLPIFFIFLLGRRLFDERSAILAALLYVTVPSVVLINLHTDQTFYPLLSIISGYLVVKSRQENNYLLGFLTGMVFFIASFLSFGLLVLAIFFVGILFFYDFSRESVKLSICIGSGFICLLLLFLWIFDYNHIDRYINATAHHVSAKGWDKTFKTFFLASNTNLIEYSLWIGLPLAMMAIYSFKNISLFNLKDQTVFTATCTAVFCVIVALLLFGKTKAETARLWMFLTPYLCLLAAKSLKDLASSDRAFAALTMFIAMSQFVASYLLLKYQDFL